MVPDRIDTEIVIDAPPEVVWAIVTEPRHVARWFSDGVEIDLRPGGAIALAWHGRGVHRGWVEVVDPPRTFSFRWVSRLGVDPGEGTTTLVEMTLVPEGGGTRLRVVESGFATLAWPDEERARHAGENTAGWARELAELRAYAGSLAAADGQ